MRDLYPHSDMRATQGSAWQTALAALSSFSNRVGNRRPISCRDCRSIQFRLTSTLDQDQPAVTPGQNSRRVRRSFARRAAWRVCWAHMSSDQRGLGVFAAEGSMAEGGRGEACGGRGRDPPDESPDGVPRTSTTSSRVRNGCLAVYRRSSRCAWREWTLRDRLQVGTYTRPSA